MNSKQLFLTIALITSLSSTAIANITISGEAKAKVNNNEGGTWMETDLTVTGKSGDTSVVAQLGLDNSNMVEQLYMTSKVAGIDIKAGEWKHGKHELNMSHTHPRSIEISTSINGVELLYRDRSGSGDDSVSIKGSIGGVTAYYRADNTKNVVKLSGSIGGVNFKLHNRNRDDGNVDNSITLKTSVQGIDLAYVETKSDVGTQADGLIWKSDYFNKASGGSIATTIAGNKIEYRDYIVDGIDTKKVIVTRKLASGATFEATYIEAAGDYLDLELAVKF